MSLLLDKIINDLSSAHFLNDVKSLFFILCYCFATLRSYRVIGVIEAVAENSQAVFMYILLTLGNKSLILQARKAWMMGSYWVAWSNTLTCQMSNDQIVQLRASTKPLHPSSDA